ncbi:NAD(P)H-dependent oxidoreductase [Paenibacillus phoenicis]
MSFSRSSWRTRSPSILKTWLDEVLTQGWAYGRNGGDKLHDGHFIFSTDN